MTADAEVARPTALAGVPVSPGVVAGRVARMAEPAGEPEPGATVPEQDREAEAARIAVAAAAVEEDLTARAARASGESAEVLEATALMAADPTLLTAAQDMVRSLGLRAERAVWDAGTQAAASLKALGGYIGERSRDLLDVRDRVVAQLRGEPPPGVPDGADPFVLVARDLAPADTATLDPSRVLALVTQDGGPTSHTAILARALGIPAVVGVAGAAALQDGDHVVVDGGVGRVLVDPAPEELDRAERLARQGKRRFSGRGATADGVPVALSANVGDPSSVRAAVEAGAEGVGLFRTEFCFLDRLESPSVDEQVDIYREVFEAFPGRKVVVRTLDAGADKPLPYVTAPDEPNPALGVRGLRTAWRSPDVLDDQLRAIARATEGTAAQVWVMAPMVATRDEAASFVARCTEVGLPHAGVMVEIPAAALTAGSLLEVAHFASLGTNDLLQYVMAADRMLTDLAGLNDHFQPALLHLVDLVTAAGRRTDRHVGVCGEAAADPVMACVLVGLGLRSLSMSAASLAGVGAALAGATLAQHEAAARAALAAPSAAQARAAAREALPHLADLGL